MAARRPHKPKLAPGYGLQRDAAGNPIAFTLNGKPLAPGARPFTPWQPPALPPSGKYDPAIDMQEFAAKRGYGDVGEDTQRGNTRDRVDYGLGVADLERNAQRAREDMQAQRDGITLDRTRGRENFDKSVADLQLAYKRRGNSQLQQQNRAGVLGGGAALQAAAKRAANEAADRAPLDTNFTRFNQDLDTQVARLDTTGRRFGEDAERQRYDLDENLRPSMGDGDLGGRRWQDRATGLVRAGREYENFVKDASTTRFTQAAGMGYTIPQRGQMGGAPANEFTGPGGPYRVVKNALGTQRIGPDGRVLSTIRRRRPRMSYGDRLNGVI